MRLVCDGGMGRDLFLVLASGGPFLAPACLFCVWCGLVFCLSGADLPCLGSWWWASKDSKECVVSLDCSSTR